MTASFIVGVPSEDRAELEDLTAQIDTESELIEHRYFDASLYIDTLFNAALSAAAWDVLKTWIKARAEIKKATRVSLGGTEITALTPRQAKKMIKMIGEHIGRNDVVDEDS